MIENKNTFMSFVSSFGKKKIIIIIIECVWAQSRCSHICAEIKREKRSFLRGACPYHSSWLIVCAAISTFQKRLHPHGLGFHLKAWFLNPFKHPHTAGRRRLDEEQIIPAWPWMYEGIFWCISFMTGSINKHNQITWSVIWRFSTGGRCLYQLKLFEQIRLVDQ